MQYLFVEQAGEQHLTLEGDEHRYIFKVRRHREGEMMLCETLRMKLFTFIKLSL